MTTCTTPDPDSLSEHHVTECGGQTMRVEATCTCGRAVQTIYDRPWTHVMTREEWQRQAEESERAMKATQLRRALRAHARSKEGS